MLLAVIQWFSSVDCGTAGRIKMPTKVMGITLVRAACQWQKALANENLSEFDPRQIKNQSVTVPVFP